MSDKKTAEPEKISMTNTKKEMLAAYNSLLQTMKEKEREELNPRKNAEEKRAEQAVKTADEFSTEGVINKVSDLRNSISKMLGSLTDQLDTEVTKYSKIKEAVDVKQKELSEMFEIEKSAQSLAALIEAYNQKKAEMDTEIARQKHELEKEIQEQREEWENEKVDVEVSRKQAQDEEKKKQQRVTEEFEYEFNRRKKLAEDEFVDRKRKQETELRIKKEETERALEEREKNVSGQEKELADLKKQVEQFPVKLQTEIDKAVKEALKNASVESAHNEQILRTEFNGERKALEAQVQNLQETLKEKNQQNVRMAEQLEKAYAKVEDIAGKSIEGASSKSLVTELQNILKDRDGDTKARQSS